MRSSSSPRRGQGAARIRISGEELGATLFAPLTFPLMMPFIPLILADERAKEARVTDWKDREFKDVKLNKDDSTHGFVFFTSYNVKMGTFFPPY